MNITTILLVTFSPEQHSGNVCPQSWSNVPNVSRFFFHARFIARNGKVMSDDSKIIAEK